MKIGLVGLGKMGEAIAYRLIKNDHEVFAYDTNIKTLNKTKKIKLLNQLSELPTKVNVIWIMVPAGEAVDEVIKELSKSLKKGNILIDGGNSHFKDSIQREKKLAKKEIYFLDCGTSGGLKGREIGFSLMIGGNKKAYTKLIPLFKSIAAKNGFGYVGKSGAGHYVKMIHNGIEYAILQSYAEGLNLIKNGLYKNLDLENITNIWKEGSVIRSWILDLINEILKEDQELKNISGEIGENKTGFWTAEEAEKQKINVDLIKRALEIRKWSRETGGDYATKLVAMMRNKFGGHPVKKINNTNSKT